MTKTDRRVSDVVERHARRHCPTQIRISKRIRSLLIGVGIVLVAIVLRAAPSIPVILLGGATLALILSFPVRLLSRILPRKVAILVTLLGLVGVLTVGLLVLLPVLVGQLTGLISALPGLASEADRGLLTFLETLHERNLLAGEPKAVIDNIRQNIFDRSQSLAQAALTGLLTTVSSTFTFTIRLFGMLFVAVYLLIDIRRIKAAYLRLAPQRYRHDARDLWDAFTTSLSRYLIGTLASITIQGVFVGAALWLLGVPYAALLGAWVTATAIIPNLGAILGAIPAVILAFFVSSRTGFLTLVVYVAIQQFESTVLTPRIQGQAVRVHPVLILLAILGAAEVFGLAGAVFAVPTLAVLRVLAEFLLVRVRVSP